MTATSVEEIDGKTVVYLDLSDSQRKELEPHFFGKHVSCVSDEHRKGLEDEGRKVLQTLLPDYYQLLSKTRPEFDDHTQYFTEDLPGNTPKQKVEVHFAAELLGNNLNQLGTFFSSAHKSHAALLQSSLSEITCVPDDVDRWCYAGSLTANDMQKNTYTTALTALLNQQTITQTTQRYHEHAKKPFHINRGIELYLFNPTTERVTAAAQEFLRFKSHLQEHDEAINDVVAALEIHKAMFQQVSFTAGTGQKYVQQEAERYLQRADKLVTSDIPRRDFSMLAGMTLNETNTSYWNGRLGAA